MNIKNVFVAVMAVCVVLSAGTMGVAAGDAPDDGILPDDDGNDTVEPATTSTDAQAQNHPTGEWTVLSNEGRSSEEPQLGIGSVAAQHDADTLYFKAEFHGDFNAHDEIDLAYFLDTDQNRFTGLNNDTMGWYYMSDIGADYAAVAGLEGDGIWTWEESTWTQNAVQFTYSDFDYANDTVVVGIDRASIGNPESVDFLVGNAMTSPWDYVPDRGDGHLTYAFETQTSPEAAFSVNQSTAAVGETVSFNASGSEGAITSYEWDFNGDGVTDAVGETATFQYSEAGEYNASLTVTDANGVTASTTKTVTVTTADDGDTGDNATGAVVTLSPEAPSVTPGSTTTVDVVVENTGDIATYAFNASVNNTPALQIEEIALQGGPSIQNVTISPDGGTATVDAALASIDATNGATIAEVTLAATEPSTGALTVSVNTLGDAQGVKYNISDGTETATVRTQAGPGDITGNGNAATDPDDDGAYEDVNGDGSANVLDVQALFGNLGSESVSGNTAFDINGDGSVNILDVQALFTQV